MAHHHLYPTGPAEEAELKVDDTIEQINGKSAENITEDELANELKGPVGSEVILQVRSSGSERRVSLVLRDVF
jgi:C-terminal processing protease CtpA/Prc